MGRLTIGQAAKTANVNVETIRFYERKGLLEQPEKPRNGFRKYEEDAIDRIRFIKRSQALGFTLAEVNDLLLLSSQHCDKALAQAEGKLNEVQEKIRDLEQVKNALLEVIATCRSSPSDSDCPILASLAEPVLLVGEIE